MARLGNLGHSIGRAIGSKKIAAPLIAASFLGGITQKTGEAAISGTMDVAFGTPDADNMMLGGMDLSPSVAMGALAPGVFGSVGRIMNPISYGMYGEKTAATALGLGSAIGTVGGGYAGFRAGQSIKGKAFGSIAGAIAGGTVGTMAGAGVIAGAVSAPYRQSPAMFRNSPYYNTSLSNAERLNAHGDIVLGMHNSRRG